MVAETIFPGDAPSSGAGLPAGGRLYQRLARLLFDQLSSGRYAIGDRLPAERELSLEHNVSRPAVREALIALEVQGYIVVRLGSGAFVRKLPGQGDRPGFAITAFELTEARILFEGEAAALAAVHIDDGELAQLAELVERIDQENLLPDVTEDADRDFHMLIASATRNAAVLRTIESFWLTRATSPECALLHDKARSANIGRWSPNTARSWMRCAPTTRSPPGWRCARICPR